MRPSVESSHVWNVPNTLSALRLLLAFGLFLLIEQRLFVGATLLFLVAASGLALMLLKGTPALAVTLCIHLGAVMGFFATMPYGKFAHGVYRGAALLKWSIEKRAPSKLKLADD